MLRIGNSIDFHPFKENRDFILGGIKIDYCLGLDGISDGDALLHSIAEAILGALALGDLGKFFKEEDSKGIDSKIILKKTVSMMKDMNYRVVNVDSMVLIEKPRLAPYIDAIKDVIAKILEIDKSYVSVKATTMEKRGIIGKGEGVLAETVILLEGGEK
ncbi:2-C-methyl-D-erythritol 2,4-cyclodiphosphate synthase [bacterium]|nr:2-C-methyl-D-erythritol 2,4-cyclodiphosphate synthase [bacterium]